EERVPHRLPAHDEHDRRHDRDDEETPVDRRVVEEGVDAEERGVRVPDVELRVLEDVPRLVLVEADAGEEERHRGELEVEELEAKRVPWKARNRERDDRERDVE